LVRNETSPEDVHGMMVSQGILTARGGLVSHAAVVARGWGTPAIVGAEAVRIEGKQFSVGGIVVKEGDVISLDGASGEVVVGELKLEAAKPPKEFEIILKWADEIRKGKLAVRANADTGEDAKNARELGAEGIGLCRTEHMFLAPDRLPVVRRMILADTPEEETAALEELRKVQKEDFAAIFREMSGLPVTVRLLDPPLHEFLPRVLDLEVKKASVGLSHEEEKLLEAAESWAEFNPMIGTRGVRLGVIKPGLYAMQVRALMEAADQVSSEGFKPIAEVMIPLTVTREELALARSWVEEVLRENATRPAPMNKGKKVSRPKVTIGTMIETPRAALRADELAEEADFFSFGTNDLTQLVFGFSRDDIESRMMPAYLEAGLLKRNPFETIDANGVGELVFLAAQRGRKVKRDLKLGVCGEHGGDPESIELFYKAGLNYVSCSPFRVPIARLSAAQSVLGTKRSETK
jgi:pyruvate,orthophosphate dikinase